jgi:hypothetical protein
LRLGRVGANDGSKAARSGEPLTITGQQGVDRRRERVGAVVSDRRCGRSRRCGGFSRVDR